MKIAFIGGGNMGEAILAAMLSKKLGTPSSISISDVDESRRKYLGDKYGVTATAQNRTAAEGKDIVVLAIKPQTLGKVLPELSGQLKPSQLVLSIIAGARIETLRNGLKHQCIVRSMPNTPAQVGEGITVWTATTEATPAQKKQAGAILGALGKEIYVNDEKVLDMATAVSGSGPAYFFLFVELLTEAAAKIGIPMETASELVLQTMVGSARLIQHSGKSPAELRRMVTSPGGTTAEAIGVFEKGNFRQLVTDAVTAAYNKAKQLGG